MKTKIKRLLSILCCLALLITSLCIIPANAETTADTDSIAVSIPSGSSFTFTGTQWYPQAGIDIQPVKPTQFAHYISFDFSCTDIDTVIANCSAGSRSSVTGEGFTYNAYMDLGIYFNGSGNVSSVGVVQALLKEAFVANRDALAAGETVRLSLPLANTFTSQNTVTGINIMVAHDAAADNLAGIGFTLENVSFDKTDGITLPLTNGTAYKFINNPWYPQLTVATNANPMNYSKYLSFDFSCTDIDTLIASITNGSRSSSNVDATVDTMSYSADTSLKIYFQGTNIDHVGVPVAEFTSVLKANRDALANSETVRLKFDLANSELLTTVSNITGICFMPSHSSGTASLVDMDLTIDNVLLETDHSSEPIALTATNGSDYAFALNPWYQQLDVPVNEAITDETVYEYLYMDVSCSDIDTLIANITTGSRYSYDTATTWGSSMVYGGSALKIWFTGTNVSWIGVSVAEFTNVLNANRDALANGETATLAFRLTNYDLFDSGSKITGVLFMPSHGDSANAAIQGIEWDIENIYLDVKYDGDIRDAVPSVSVGKDETEMYITWFTSSNKKGSVMLSENGTQTVFEAYESYPSITEGYYCNRAKITGLKANTDYTYCVGTDGDWSEEYPLSTKDFDSSFSFIQVSDVQIKNIASMKENWNTTLSHINQNFPDTSFIINTGDVVDDCTDNSVYMLYKAPDLLKSYITGVVPGNHDLATANSLGETYSLYNEHFTMPDTGEAYTGFGENEYDYWYSYNNVLFISLNTNIKDTAYHEAFVRKVVEEQGDKYDWKIVNCHHSLFGATYQTYQTDTIAFRENLAPVFSELGIDMVISGHDHCYDRSYIMNETTPVVSDKTFASNTNGGVLYISNLEGTILNYGTALEGATDYSAKIIESKYGFINYEVREGSLKLTLYSSEDMSVLDEFTLYKAAGATADDLVALKKAVLNSITDGITDYNEDGVINIRDVVSLKKRLANAA